MNDIKINEDYSFKTTNKDGLEVICDTLAVINLDNLNPIIIYTDYTLDQNNNFNVYISKIIKNEDNFQLEEIENYNDIPEISKALQKIWDN